MSTDEIYPGTVSSAGRRLPDRETVVEMIVFFCYLTTIIGGLTLLITLELLVRL